MEPSLPIHLCGPTASGKSALAIELARHFDGEIVNADAFQLYRGLETLTAAPSSEEQSLVPHHLYGVLAPDQTCDAMRYREMALPVLKEIISRGKTPILTGGSGLYLKFITHGPSPLPSGNPEIRKQHDQLSLEELVARLQKIDPKEAARTDLQNRRYVSRIVEICELSGQPCSTLRDQWQSKTLEISEQLRGIYIQRQRPDLHSRIASRSKQMLESGAVEEVRQLSVASTNLEKAIGFSEIRDWLDGKSDQASCLEKIEAATRQYAKRQETWFRREKWLRPVAWAPDLTPPTQASIEALANKL